MASAFQREKFAEMFEDFEKLQTGEVTPLHPRRQEEELKKSVTGLQGAR
jgi:hypothetical protein